MKKLDYDDVISRIGFFRNKANLSAREMSFRLDKGELYMARIENKQVELKVSTLLQILDVLGITVEDFFYLGSEYNEEDKELIDVYSSLSHDNKKFVMEFMKKLRCN